MTLLKRIINNRTPPTAIATTPPFKPTTWTGVGRSLFDEPSPICNETRGDFTQNEHKGNSKYPATNQNKTHHLAKIIVTPTFHYFSS